MPNSECTASILLRIIVFITMNIARSNVNKYDRTHPMMGSYGSWWLEKAHSQVLYLYHCLGTIFSSEIWLPHCQWQSLATKPLRLHGGSPIRACHNSRWHLLSPHIPTMLHFLDHIWAESLELQLGMLQNMLLLFMHHSELAAFT